jgi:hypothetical protein
MARSVGNEIPPEIRPLFESEDIASLEGLTFLVLTTTEDGWPHLAMISVGRLAHFAVRVEDAIVDVAPYATLTTGVRYELKDPPSVLPRWRDTVKALRETP